MAIAEISVVAIGTKTPSLSKYVARVVTTVKIDDRRDKASTRDSKIQSVKRELGQA